MNSRIGTVKRTEAIPGSGHSIVSALLTLLFAVSGQKTCFGQAERGSAQASYTKICTIYFDRDARRPARVEDSSLGCLLQASRMLLAKPRTQLYLIATADRTKDGEAGHGTARTKQDMTGEDLRYADVAAYRAVNTKAYMVRWLKINPRRIVPLTTYEDGQWLEIYSAPSDAPFRTIFSKRTAPILSRPCTVAPCAAHNEEFLIAQPRSRIHK